MTAEEIKEKYSMRDIAVKYGLEPTRAGFICCPFHKGDREPSLKLYDKSYYCFGCGAAGDIFSFVQQMEQMDFKSAFLLLGGTYQGADTFTGKLARYRAEKGGLQKEREQEKLKKKRELNSMLIDIYRDYLKKYEPLSDEWCETYNALQYQFYLQEYLFESEKR